MAGNPFKYVPDGMKIDKNEVQYVNVVMNYDPTLIPSQYSFIPKNAILYTTKTMDCFTILTYNVDTGAHSMTHVPADGTKPNWGALVKSSIGDHGFVLLIGGLNSHSEYAMDSAKERLIADLTANKILPGDVTVLLHDTDRLDTATGLNLTSVFLSPDGQYGRLTKSSVV